MGIVVLGIFATLLLIGLALSIYMLSRSTIREAALAAELRTNDEVIVAQSRDAALGGLVAHLSHRWRQPLNVLGLVLQAIEMRSEAGELDAKAMSGYVKKGLDELRTLEGLLDEYRRYFGSGGEGVFSIRGAIEASLRLQSPALEELGVRTSVECPSELEAEGDSLILATALAALVNISISGFAARKEMPPTIAIRAWAGAKDSITIVTSREGGAEAGRRTDAADRGLYGCKLIIERVFGGRLAASGRDGVSTFSIELPRRGKT